MFTQDKIICTKTVGAIDFTCIPMGSEFTTGIIDFQLKISIFFEAVFENVIADSSIQIRIQPESSIMLWLTFRMFRVLGFGSEDICLYADSLNKYANLAISLSQPQPTAIDDQKPNDTTFTAYNQ